MPKNSAGLLLYRFRANILEVFLVHPGGPFWAKKDEHAWSIPKGEFDEGEDALEAAKRELIEETGIHAEGNFIPLNTVRQKGGKNIIAWALECDADSSVIKSNHFSMEWPPRSGIQRSFPEIDKAGWFDVAGAKHKIIEAQFALVEELEAILWQPI